MHENSDISVIPTTKKCHRLFVFVILSKIMFVFAIAYCLFYKYNCCKYFYFYFSEIRPPSKKGSPVIVDFSIFVVDINSINVEDMDFR